MAQAVVMPKQGQTVESCIIARWSKQVGDVVAQGDVLCEVETDKAVLEVESPGAGVLLAQFFKAGDDVPVMTTIAVIGQLGEDVLGFLNLETIHQDSVHIPAQSNVEADLPASVPAVSSPSKNSPIDNGLANSRVTISPRARNLAARRGLVTAGIQGSGPNGRIIERDILAALNARPRMTPLAQSMVESGDYAAPERSGRITTKDLTPISAGTPSVSSGEQRETRQDFSTSDEDVEVIPLKGVRKIIAERMLNSLQTTAQLTLSTTADARALLAYRKRLKESPDSLGLQKITLNDLVMFITARTLTQFPDLNTLLENEALYRHRRVHLGFAVDTPRGLVVPVIHDANGLSLKQLAVETGRLAQACVDSRITPSELNGGTFTMSNLGSFGIEHFTPVLNPPQVGILGVGNINLKAVEVDGDVAHIPHIGLSLTVNHQAVDGAPAARFLQALSRNLAQIELLLAV